MDDRGVGGSTGKLLDSTDEDFAGDVLACVAYLKQRKEIDPSRIGLLGHSEGAVVAAMAAARSPEIAFLVLLAGPAIPGDRLQLAQAERVARVMGVPDRIAERDREVQRKLFALARSGATAKQLEAALSAETARLPPDEAAAIRAQLGRQIGTASSRWFRSVLSYDPRAALERLTCPTLAIYGTLDVQVPADLNAPAMEQAMSKNSRAKVLIIDGLNHMLQKAETGSPLEYTRIEETVSEEVLQAVLAWLQ
jgi:pimeloyl-ACP methyl ester carboxylesterase